MVEHIIIGIIFLIALGYLIYIARMSFSTKQTGCAKGCGTCSSIDFKKIKADVNSHQKAIK